MSDITNVIDAIIGFYKSAIIPIKLFGNVYNLSLWTIIIGFMAISFIGSWLIKSVINLMYD